MLGGRLGWRKVCIPDASCIELPILGCFRSLKARLPNALLPQDSVC
jgi:hypothetical protein